MVKVLHFVGLGAAVATALMTTVQASSMNCNPSQDTEVGAPMDSCNPAYGGEIDESCIPSIDVSDSEQCKQTTGSVDIAGSSTNTLSLRRMEDASNSDVADLETYFGESLELDFTTLKEQYSSASAPVTPWPGSYWPSYQDSINVIWKSGDKSASEKYAEAYGLDPTDFTKKISAKTGIDSRSSSTPCSADADCASRQDGSVCAMHKNATSGYCIPTWYGLCHAWAPAALLEAEPKCDVVKNNLTFHVMDIKALLTDVYDGSSISTMFTGARFNGPDSPADMDSYGRYTSAARRDLGPGFFHIAISNILGKHNQSFIVDVASGAQVWNQPVRSYNVQTMELVDANQASQKYFAVSPYPFNSEMVYLAYVKTTLSWIVEAYADGPLVATGKVDAYTVSDDYEYLLELDANYAVIGGEWIEGSKTDHPDFLWFPTAKPDSSTITSTGLSYANVEELLELSLSCGASEQASAGTSDSASDMSASLSTSNSGSTSMGTSSASASISASSSASASTFMSTSTSVSAGALMSASSSGDSSSGTTSTVPVESMSVSTSAAASASTSTSPSASSSASMSASGRIAASASGSTSQTTSIGGSTVSEGSGNNSIGNEASTENSGTGTNEDASAEVAESSATSGESSYAARDASGDQSSAVTPTGERESNEGTNYSPSSGTTNATATYRSGSTEGETAGSLPSGKDAFIHTPNIITPGTTSNEESTAATHTPIGIWNYTPPPTANGQDLADVIDTIDTSLSVTNASSSSMQETTTATTTITSASVHLSC